MVWIKYLLNRVFNASLEKLSSALNISTNDISINSFNQTECKDFDGLMELIKQKFWFDQEQKE